MSVLSVASIDWLANALLQRASKRSIEIRSEGWRCSKSMTGALYTKLPQHQRTRLLLPWQWQLPFEACDHLRTQSCGIRATRSICLRTLRKLTPSLKGRGLDPVRPQGFRNNCG